MNLLTLSCFKKSLCENKKIYLAMKPNATYVSDGELSMVSAKVKRARVNKENAR